ncbi:lasso peptide biosynthesis B2 protein [Paenibacillus sp. NFR01]|uniref:lasso peptide biosynthesis B2 protein n=1 Tax=Paenibacillus sp. NFR01 TaxID=1566279 RepID=UPI0008B62762|nr:lasso peptide biosynthesis B2 protein [Paenibacillus sp. NFR01]SEU28414.1 Transglutaminase-like superfamily protein [Paenibacillus sp. NFR01]
MIVKLRKLAALDRATLALFPEAFWRLFAARIFLLLPFYRTAPRLGLQSCETTSFTRLADIPHIRGITKAISIMGRCTPWRSNCMVRAVAGLRMLEKRGIESTLYMGVARDREGRMIAHAWLRSGMLYVSGDDAMKGFTVVEKFAKTR